MSGEIIRIGTRGSQLAKAQASEVRARLMVAHDLPEEAFAIEVISTSGDRINRWANSLHGSDPRLAR